jgi:chemotaxis signal transduction protein
VRLTRQSRRKHRSPQTQPVILFVVGEYTFAIAASAVTEIQSVEEMKPLGSQIFRCGKVHHTIKREGRRYWVVDANIHFSMLPTHSTRVLMLAGSPVAVKVDAIVRMAEIEKVLALPRSFTGDERNWYVGLTLINGKVVPVVNPASFLSEGELTTLTTSTTTQVAAENRVGVLA